MTENAKTIGIICPHCAFSRNLAAGKVPDKPVKVTCPKCSKAFRFTKKTTPASPVAETPPLVDPASKHELLSHPIVPPRVTRIPLSTPAKPTPKVVPTIPDFTPEIQPAYLPINPPKVTSIPSSVSAEPSPKPAPLPLVILSLLLVIVAAVWLNFPQADRIQEGAYIDPKNQFAVKAPADWMLITPDNYQTIMKQYKDRIPKELAGFIANGKPGFVVSYFRIPETETEYAPNFNIVVVDTKGKNLPSPKDSDKDQIADMVFREYSRLFDGYKMEESNIVTIDRLDSVKITGATDLTVVTKPSEPIYSEPGAFGRRKLLSRTQEEKQTFHIRMLQTMIPGKMRAYVLSFMYDDLKTPEMSDVENEISESFRVLERPPRFGSIALGAFNGGLIGAGIYLLSIVFSRRFKTE